MNKYSVLINSDKLKGVVRIPSKFAHKEVNIEISLPPKKTFNPRKFRGICNEKKETIDKELKQMRIEWGANGE